MKKILLATGLFATSLAGTQALADPVTGTRLEKSTPSQGVALSKRDSAIAAREMTRCLFDRRRGAALSLLAAADASSAEAAHRNLEGNMDCFNSVMANDLVGTRIATYSLDVLRGGIAEAALSRQKAAARALQPLPLQQSRYMRPWFAATSRDSAVDEMAVCVADTNPAGLLGVLATAPETDKEKAAFGAITDNLGKCLVAGARLHANREALRAALADALYQRIRNPALSIPPPMPSPR